MVVPANSNLAPAPTYFTAGVSKECGSTNCDVSRPQQSDGQMVDFSHFLSASMQQEVPDLAPTGLTGQSWAPQHVVCKPFRTLMSYDRRA